MQMIALKKKCSGSRHGVLVERIFVRLEVCV